MRSRTDALYASPEVTDYGTLREWTGSHHLFIGKQIIGAAAALSVTIPTGTPGGQPGGTPGGVQGATGGGFSAAGVIHAVAGSTGSTPHKVGSVLGATQSGVKGAGSTGVGPGTVIAAHGSGGGSGSGGSLPFTGLPVVISASVGAGLMTAGAWFRWAARRGSRPNTPL